MTILKPPWLGPVLEDLGLKKEHIVFFLHQFAGMDYTDVNCQKRLIKAFVNSVFVYDDRVVLTLNYSGDNRTMTLKEIDAGLQQGVRIPDTNAYQKSGYPLGICFSFSHRNRLERLNATVRWTVI